ncbi:MAG: hypothetical protein AAFX93_18990 [Verrucomicrobiota bacterium]
MKLLSLALVSLASLAVGFYVRGFFVAPSSVEEQVIVREVAMPSQNEEDQIELLVPSSTPDVIVESLDASGLTGEQLQEILQSLDGFLLMEVLRRDPGAAARLMLSRGPATLERYKNELVEAWRFRDPVAAYDWLQRNQSLFSKEGYARKQILVLEEMARQAPREATRYLGMLRLREDRDQLVIALASGWAKADVQQAFTALAEFEAYDISEYALTQGYVAAFTAYAEVDPEDAKELFGQLENEVLQRQLVQPILRHLGTQNLNSAIQWSLNQPNESLRDSAIDHLVIEFGYQDPERLLASVLDRPEALPPQSVIKMIGPLSEMVPKQVIGVLEQLDSGGNADVAETAISSWLRKDYDAALVWLQNQDNPEFHDAGAKATSTHLLASDPVAATKWAFEVDDVEERMQLIENATMVASFEQLSEMEQTVQVVELGIDEKAQVQRLLEKQKRKYTASLLVPY